VEPTDTPAPKVPALSGKLAIPIDDGLGHYDVVIYQLPDGNVVGKIPRSRQPNFRPDGVTLLVNGEAGANENIWEYNANGSGGRAVSASPGDQHPFYNRDGNSVVYDNPQLVIAKLSGTEWHIFVQYGLAVPDTSAVATNFVLTGDIFDGNTPLFPVWAADYSILFRACDYWKSGGSCGIWKASSGMTRAGGESWNPPAFLVGDNAQPTDTKGSSLVYMSRATGNWDVYVTSINGGGGVNITNNAADDGLGTLSPDGQWVAFVSNRDGRWGVWAAPAGGGTAQRLPIDIPSWVNEYGGWTVERISWGP
jgi:Tol biopolymer transport system component